ncbi:hypothetical protein E2C01_061034 [Portunus trituberculatus]|uniref:Uncharacterized protein n=1 Tax=Portunus trituberculatus TaxID=210409 RepID=A0A5B7HAN4_PORTR|nr:hypothetical protein [Portunus trituberculatus]
MTDRNPGVAVWPCVVVLAALTTGAMSQRLLPSLLASQEDSPLANLWRHGLRNQKNSNGEALRSDKPAPKTYLAPPYGEVMNWVPQDSAHPLYVPENANFLREILFDNMVEGEVNPDDPRMSEREGLQVHNLNGKTLTFTRDASGKPLHQPLHRYTARWPWNEKIYISEKERDNFFLGATMLGKVRGEFKRRIMHFSFGDKGE